MHAFMMRSPVSKEHRKELYRDVKPRPIQVDNPPVWLYYFLLELTIVGGSRGGWKTLPESPASLSSRSSGSSQKPRLEPVRERC